MRILKLNEIFFQKASIQQEKTCIFVFLNPIDNIVYPGKQKIIVNGIVEIYDDESIIIYGLERNFKYIHDIEIYNDSDFLDKVCPNYVHEFKIIRRTLKSFFLTKEEKTVRGIKNSGWKTLKKANDFRMHIVKGKYTLIVGGYAELNS
jgi:hypothetical protein